MSPSQPLFFFSKLYFFSSTTADGSLKEKKHFLPLHANIDFSGAVVQRVEPALHEQSPLDSESSDQEVESYAAEAVTFQEGHEETKTNKDHHMHILEA